MDKRFKSFSHAILLRSLVNTPKIEVGKGDFISESE